MSQPLFIHRALLEATRQAAITGSISPALALADQYLQIGYLQGVKSRGVLVLMFADRLALYEGYDLLTENDPYRCVRRRLLQAKECSAIDVYDGVGAALLAFGNIHGFLGERQWERVRAAIEEDCPGQAMKYLWRIRRISESAARTERVKAFEIGREKPPTTFPEFR